MVVEKYSAQYVSLLRPTSCWKKAYWWLENRYRYRRNHQVFTRKHRKALPSGGGCKVCCWFCWQPRKTSRILAAMKSVIKTLSVRVRDKHARVLNRMAFDVESSMERSECGLRWIVLGGDSRSRLYEFGYVCFWVDERVEGIRKERGMMIDSTAVQETIAVMQKPEAIHRKKTSCIGVVLAVLKKALGWIPFKSGRLSGLTGQVRYAGLFQSLG